MTLMMSKLLQLLLLLLLMLSWRRMKRLKKVFLVTAVLMVKMVKTLLALKNKAAAVLTVINIIRVAMEIWSSSNGTAKADGRQKTNGNRRRKRGNEVLGKEEGNTWVSGRMERSLNI